MANRQTGNLSTKSCNPIVYRYRKLVTVRALSSMGVRYTKAVNNMSMNFLSEIENSGMSFAKKFNSDFDPEIIQYFLNKTL